VLAWIQYAPSFVHRGTKQRYRPRPALVPGIKLDPLKVQPQHNLDVELAPTSAHQAQETGEPCTQSGRLRELPRLPKPRILSGRPSLKESSRSISASVDSWSLNSARAQQANIRRLREGRSNNHVNGLDNLATFRPSDVNRDKAEADAIIPSAVHTLPNAKHLGVRHMRTTALPSIVFMLDSHVMN